MRAVAGARTLHSNRNIVLTAYYSDHRNVILPTFIIKINCEKFRCFIRQHSVGADYITAKFITSYIGQYNSIAVGVDLGLNYYNPDTEWSFSAVARNLGGELKAYDEEYGKMPLDVMVGATKRLGNSPLRLSASLVDLTHWNYKFINHWVFGVDILLGEQFYVAAGYNLRRANEMKIVANDEEKGSSHGAGISLGAGLQLERFKLQVAYGKYHVSSSSLMINLSYSL